MPFLIKAADLATRNFPKILTPQAHKKADYILMIGFGLAGLVYWKRDRRAAIASILCGGSMLALTLTTHYNVPVGDQMSFSEHKRAELGMAALCSLLPGVLQTGKMARTHFLAQAAALIAVSNMTRAER